MVIIIWCGMAIFCVNKQHVDKWQVGRDHFKGHTVFQRFLFKGKAPLFWNSFRTSENWNQEGNEGACGPFTQTKWLSDNKKLFYIEKKTRQKQNETYTHFCLDLDTVRCNPAASPGFPRPASRPAHKETYIWIFHRMQNETCSLSSKTRHPKKVLCVCIWEVAHKQRRQSQSDRWEGGERGGGEASWDISYIFTCIKCLQTER